MDGRESAEQYRCCDEYEEYRRRQRTFRQSRRSFLKGTIGTLAVAPIMPEMFLKSALALGLELTPEPPIQSLW